MSEVLYKRTYNWGPGNEPHWDKAYETIQKELARSVPDTQTQHREISIDLTQRRDGTATLSVKVVNTERKPLTRTQENWQLAFYLAVIAIIVGLIAYV